MDIDGNRKATTNLVASTGQTSEIVVCLTGLSSAGKTTLSQKVANELRNEGHPVQILDGDLLRTDLCRDLGFSKADRDENIRRIGFVAQLLATNGILVIVAAVSPYRAARDEVRSRIETFIEVYVNAPLVVCEQRDVKGLYRRARSGQLTGLTGVDDPYEPPLSPELECRTDQETVDSSMRKILDYVRLRLLNVKNSI